MFCDTGLEFPEIKDFVRSTDNVVWIKPKMSFRQVLDKYGYPVVSKVQAQYIYQYRNTKSEKTRMYRWCGKKGHTRSDIGKISEKWKHLTLAPFKISDKCCDVMKKGPIHIYEKQSGNKPYIGTMAANSRSRAQQYLQEGCNAFGGDHPGSKPMSIWTEADVWEYLKTRNVPYCSVYDMGYKATGCVFCAFGVHMEDEPNRFQRMANTHPKLYSYCMKDLGMKEVLEWVGVPWWPESKLFDDAG